MNTRFPRFKFQKEYFIFLLPLFFVLHAYRENGVLVTFKDAYQSLITYLLVILLIAAVSFFLFRSRRKAAVFTFFLVAFDFFFGAMHDAAKSLLGEVFIVKYSFIIPVSLIAFILLVIFLKRTNRDFNRFTNYANILFILLIVFDIASIAVIRSKTKKITTGLPPGFVKCDSCTRPDIYFIVADEYAGHQQLQDIFHFDNSPFENALRARGFYVVPDSKSNYNSTPHSLGSMLSMDYLAGVESKGDLKGLNLAYEKINENPLADFLRSFHYEIKNYSVFKFAGQRPLVNSMFGVIGRDLIRSQTFLGRVDRDIRFNLITRWKFRSEMKKFTRDEISYSETSIQKTKEEAASKSNDPRFIYMHVMMPHYPYFFDKNGQPNAPETLLEEYKFDREKYTSYLQYCNGRFLELVDYILSHSQQPPVIIFMGDHGFRHFHQPVDQKYYFMNLNSIYLPNHDHSKFYDGMTNVNQFRVILNSAFGQKLPLLKDSTCFLR